MAVSKPIVLDSAGNKKEILSTDTIPLNNLGTGTPTSSNFLRGDGTWVAPSGTGLAYQEILRLKTILNNI